MSEIFCYVAHKDGVTRGVCSPLVGRRDLKDFLAEFAAKGYTLTPLASREDYLEFIKTAPVR